MPGRATYDGFSVSWPQRSGDPSAGRMNSLPKHVASTTLTDPTWNTTVLQGDAAEAVARLKEQPGPNLLKFGTGSSSRTLIDHGLIDELHLWRFPVIAGTSDSLCDGLPVTHLELLETTTFESGIVVTVHGPKPS